MYQRDLLRRVAVPLKENASVAKDLAPGANPEKGNR